MRGGTSEPRTGRARSGRPGGGGHGAQPLPIPPPLPAAPSRSYLPPSLRSPSSTRRGGAGRAAGLPREQPWLGRPSAAPGSHFPSRGRTSREGRRDGTGWDVTARPGNPSWAEEWPAPPPGQHRPWPQGWAAMGASHIPVPRQPAVPSLCCHPSVAPAASRALSTESLHMIDSIGKDH